MDDCFDEDEIFGDLVAESLLECLVILSKVVFSGVVQKGG